MYTFKIMGTESKSIKTTIVTTWTNTPRGIRYLLLSYGIISIGCYAMYNYNDGTRALLNFRKSGKTIYGPPDEWTAIKKGINYTDNFFSALFFPWSITEKIIPNIILYFNPL